MPLDELLRFARPEWLWALAPALVLAWWSRRPDAGSGGRGADAGSALDDPAAPDTPWGQAIDPHLLPALLAQAGARSGGGSDPSDAADRAESAPRTPPISRRPEASRVLPWRHAALLCVLVIALAGPTVPRTGTPADASPLRPEAARILVADLSPAFDALPEASRERVRTQLRRFVAALPPGETGLVVYAGDAWLVVPPTEDGAALDVFLAELSSTAAPKPGDRPEAALALARQVLAATGSRAPAIYWLAARPGAVPKELARAPGGVQPGILEVDASLDDWLAAAGVGTTSGRGGSSLNVGDPDQRFDLGPLLALIGLLLMVPLTVPGLRPWAPGLLAFMLLHEAGPSYAAGFETGVAHYRAGRYAEAAAAFSDASSATPGDAKARYNLGNALARAGRLRDALAAYDVALRLRPDDADTLHNRDLVARLLQSPKDPPPQAPPPTPPAPQASGEAERAAAQWLRAPPADVTGLLQRKLALEEARRRPAGAGPTSSVGPESSGRPANRAGHP